MANLVRIAGPARARVARRAIAALHSVFVSLSALTLAAWAEPPAQAPLERECIHLRDFEPKSAETTVFQARDAVLFAEALVFAAEPIPAPSFDSVVLKSGRDVFGGTVLLLVKGDCVLAHGFYSPLDLIHATEVARLYAERPELRQEAHVDPAKLRALANAGDPVAQFHEGLVLALGRGAQTDRAAGVARLKRSAESGYAPSMLALGMALSGPGRLEQESIQVGEPRATDQLTDYAQACFWLESAAASKNQLVEGVARGELEFQELESLMTREQRAECKRLLRERKQK